MMLDYSSLLVSLGISAICLAVTLLGSWATRRTETFLLSCTLGLFLVIIGIVFYGLYVAHPGRAIGVAAFLFFYCGFSGIWAAGYQFRTGIFSLRRVLFGAAVGTVAAVPPMIMGYDGLAFILDNLVIAILLFATAWQYWQARAEAPAPVAAISILYAVTGISFTLCASVLIADGKLVLGHAPQNWAEDLSLAICIANMTGIGALSLALHQWRLAARHERDAATDPLTGLLNRRALFERHAKLAASAAVLVFDIDHFKSINDQYGHAAGDKAIRVFAGVLGANCRTRDTAARTGGEEFALVMTDMLPGRAEIVAERIRRSFAEREIHYEGMVLRATVSVGVAGSGASRSDLDTLLSAADKALYAAKRGGRNRVEVAPYLQPIASPGRTLTAS